jgi:hypothetical protein
MDDAHPSELAGAASSSMRSRMRREAECAARRVGRASFYNYKYKIHTDFMAPKK